MEQLTVVLVGGPPGVGKSTVATGLGRALSWLVLRSDELRREVLGGEPWAGPAEWLSAHFSAAATDTTYGEMINRARTALASGRSIILDATWSSAERRAQAEEMAQQSGAVFVPLRCDAAAAVAERRVAGRIAVGPAVTTATVEVARRIATSFPAWPQARRIRSDGPLDDTLAQALRAVREAAVDQR